MNKIFNKGKFEWFVGVVEDIFDPRQIGRVKVRIYGHHSSNKDEQPTHDLPWAIPIQPITSAAISGLGSTPLGLEQGSWVVGFYLDGDDMQQPAIFGTIGADTAPTVFEETPPKPNFTLKDNDNNLKDQSGQVITKENRLSDGSKAIAGIAASSFPVKVGVPQNPNNPEPPNKPSTLPPIIKKSYTPPNAKASGIEFALNEFGGTGATLGDIARSANQVYVPGKPLSDPLNGTFGHRYGIFKLASYLPSVTPDGTRRPSAKTSPLFSFLISKYGQPFKGLFKYDIASSSFNAAWRNNGFALEDRLAIETKDRGKFASAQINYIKNTYVDAVVAQVNRMGGPTINTKLEKNNFAALHLFSLMLNNALDLGVIGSAEVITKACEGKSNLSKSDIVELVTEYMIQNSDELLSKLPQEERDTIKVDQLNQREEFKKVEIPPFNPTTSFGDYGSGFNLSVGLEGTPDEKLTYNGNDPTVYDRINNERIRRGLPRLSNPRPTGGGNREVRSTFGGTTDRFGNRITSEE